MKSEFILLFNNHRDVYKRQCVIVVTHSKEVADSADIILELSGKNLKKVIK